ncbi:MAG: hypothetical protein R6T78_02055 [Dehalococcoidales bacterium]
MTGLEPEYCAVIIEENLKAAYTPEVVDHALCPGKVGEIAGADAFGEITDF